MKKSIDVRNLVLAAMFAALAVVFTRFFSIQIGPNRFGFGQTPIMLAGIFLGPVYGFIVGVVSDLTGFFMFSSGMPHPGFTLSAGLAGLVPGLIVHYVIRNNYKFSIPVAAAIVCLLVNAVLGTIWLIPLLGKSFAVMFPARLIKNLVMTAAQSVICFGIVKSMKFFIREKRSIA